MLSSEESQTESPPSVMNIPASSSSGPLTVSSLPQLSVTSHPPPGRDPLSQWLLADLQTIRGFKTITWDAASRSTHLRVFSKASLRTQKSLAKWADNPERGPIRWLSGCPGTGKTTIAHRMAEYWAKQGRLAGSFFFSKSGGEPYSTHAQYLPGAIAYQLLQAYDVSFARVDTSGRCSWDDVVYALGLIRPNSLPLVIIIDGLGVCDDNDPNAEPERKAEEVQLLEDILAYTHQLGPSIKILISCRPDPHLKNVFDHFAQALGSSYRIDLGPPCQKDSDTSVYLPVSSDRGSQSLAFKLTLDRPIDVLRLPASVYIPLSVDHQAPMNLEVFETLSRYYFAPKPRSTGFDWYESDLARQVAYQATWRDVECPMHRISFYGHNGLQNYLDVWSVDLTHPFLWVSGCAGTGKTILARIMAEHWEREGRLAGNFFFSRSSEGRDTTRWFCQTILSQLPPDIQINTSALGQLAGRPRDYVPYGWLRITHKLASVTPPKKMIFVIDGLDECHSQDEQVKLLNALIFLRRFHPSFKILFFSRPEQHLEGVFKQFFTDKPPRVTLGESPEANDCIRTFLQQSFEKISSRRLEFNAISITDGSWPSSEMVDELVDRADGQFAYAASVVDVVDTPNRDPVRVLNQILERRSRSFKALDERYIAILEKVEQKVAESSLQLSQLMCNLLLHVISEPSSSSDIAKFWFTSKEVIDKLITHLDAVLVERDSGLIEYRHHSFHDFMSRPSLPNRFSLPGIHPVSKIYFFLRRSAMADDQTHLANKRREEERAIQAQATCSRTNSKLDHLPSTTLPISRRPSAAPAPHPELGSEFKALNSTQYLGYVFLNCNDRPPIPILYEEEARRLHRIYTVRDSTECRCLPNLWKVTSLGALRKFKPCRRKGCVIEEDLLTLCRMMELPVEVFKQEWTRWERTQFTPLVEVVKYLLWIRVLLFSMLNPLSALENTVLGLSNLVRNLDSHAFSIKSLIHGLIYGHLLLFLMLAFVNTGDHLVGYLYLAYLVITLLLQQLLRFDLTKVKHLNGFDAQWPSSSPPDRPPEAPKLVRYRQRT